MNDYTVINVSKLIELIERKYGDSDRGCYTDGGWLSPCAIIEYIEKCAEEYGM